VNPLSCPICLFSWLRGLGTEFLVMLCLVEDIGRNRFHVGTC
jgi:hypothetical protein